MKELKDEDMIKYFVEQRDSRDRSALEIMSERHYYSMLDSDEMAMIIKEKWHGPSSQSFSIYELSACYLIFNSKFD